MVAFSMGSPVTASVILPVSRSLFTLGRWVPPLLFTGGRPPTVLVGDAGLPPDEQAGNSKLPAMIRAMVLGRALSSIWNPPGERSSRWWDRTTYYSSGAADRTEDASKD